MRVLYITHNGLLDHIGESQIVPYLVGLARQGFLITIISAEKAANADRPRRRELEKQLGESLIEWHSIRYHKWPPLISTALDLMRLYLLAAKVARRGEVGLLHCRGFLPALVGSLAKRRFGIPTIFDFRDFWADRGMYAKRFKAVYRWFKAREGWMVRSADHVVTLTARARRILWESYLRETPGSSTDRITVIPTCADFSLFDPRRSSEADREACRQALGIPRNSLVLGYLGTFHDDYLPAEMFHAFRLLQVVEANSVFVLVSPTDSRDIFPRAAECGIEPASIRVVSATRDGVPGYVAIFDLSVVFIRADASTAGVFPTKLAELFACNIPVLVNGGIGDLDEIVRPETNDSVVVQSFSDEALLNGITELVGIVRSSERRGRINSLDLSLEEGIRRYRSVYLRFVRPQSFVSSTQLGEHGV
jgi:glycosyltransferase involved in cell wall biosynthesis